MGNDVNFFSLAPKGRRSEYVAIAPQKMVNGVKGSIIKRWVILIPTLTCLTTLIRLMCISGRMRMVFAKLVCTLDRKIFRL